jgi:hypothetical protein
MVIQGLEFLTMEVNEDIEGNEQTKRQSYLPWCILKRESELRSYDSPAVNFIVYAVNQHRSKMLCGKVLKEAFADTNFLNISIAESFSCILLRFTVHMKQHNLTEYIYHLLFSLF